MYTYEEVVDVQLAIAEAGLTLLHYSKTDCNIADLEITVKVVNEYCKRNLSDNGKELYDKLVNESRISGSPQCIECTELLFDL